MNPNLFVWTSDWHIGRRLYVQMQAVAAHIVSLNPAGVIDTGDCKEHPGVSSAGELDRYVTDIRNVLPWANVNPGFNAHAPILPGNHDEIPGYTDPQPNDFSLFDARLWGPPYHWTCDWAAPRIRFLGFHTELVRPPSKLRGFGRVEAAEIQWLEGELDDLPQGWQAIVCSHFPANIAFGAEIRKELGGIELLAVLSAHKTRIAAYLNGHRHANMNTDILDQITHINGPGVSYTRGNSYGGFSPIDYNPAARTLTFRYLLGVSPFAGFSGFTPIVLQLPSLNSDLELAIAELKLTDVGYLNDDWTEPPEGSHWDNALDILEDMVNA